MDKKVGTIYGVLVPNITGMLGIILFLRLSVLVGHSGIDQMISVLLLALGFMMITSLSIASIATNMRMGSGGVYYLITRSLGIEIGGTVGLALYISQIISIALTASGFAYILCRLFPQLSLEWVEGVTLLSLGLLSSVSSRLALKFQIFVLGILLLAITSIFMGSMENVTELTATKPLFPGGTLTFWETFAFFYPALTGIEAGMAMSGILRNPGRSLFLGNIGGLLFSAVIYLSLSIFSFLSIPHEYLISDPFIFISFAHSNTLTTIGILTATLSSTLGCILGAPRILEAMAKDGLVPSIFSKSYGIYSEPRWALWTTVFFALLTALFTNIDQIIPILTMICLISYGLLNLVAGLGELMNTASWRPTVRISWWLSIFGFILAVIFMLFINLTWTFIALGLFITFFLLIQGRNLTANFQDFRDSIVFFFSRTALYHLSSPSENALVWHAQLLVIATGISQKRKLAFLSHHLTVRSGLLTFSAIVPSTWNTPEQIESSKASIESLLEKEGLSGIAFVLPAESNLEGHINLIKAYGIGPIQPNTIVIPFSQDDDPESLFEIMKSCRMMRKNLILFRDSERVEEILYTEAEHEKNIDIWWDDQDRNGFDFSVSLATTLRDTKVWGQGTYTIQAVVNSKSSLGIMRKYFKRFLKKSRLPFNANVNLEANASSYLSYIPRYSAKADLTIVCIRTFEESESTVESLEYLEEVIDNTKDLKDCLYICCYDNIEHKEIYHYP